MFLAAGGGYMMVPVQGMQPAGGSKSLRCPYKDPDLGRKSLLRFITSLPLKRREVVLEQTVFQKWRDPLVFFAPACHPPPPPPSLVTSQVITTGKCHPPLWHVTPLPRGAQRWRQRSTLAFVAQSLVFCFPAVSHFCWLFFQWEVTWWCQQCRNQAWEVSWDHLVLCSKDGWWKNFRPCPLQCPLFWTTLFSTSWTCFFFFFFMLNDCADNSAAAANDSTEQLGSQTPDEPKFNYGI